ncbi:MAG: hypothetical protein HQK54_18435, partial [Oligoflexales bacterium]|nr:hypothetical protein [Oligoflexales bacterium]
MQLAKGVKYLATVQEDQEQKYPDLSLAYILDSKIYDGRKSLVYHARDANTGQPVILKLLQRDFETSKDIDRVRHEFALLNKLNLPSVRRVLHFARIGGSTALIFE